MPRKDDGAESGETPATARSGDEGVTIPGPPGPDEIGRADGPDTPGMPSGPGVLAGGAGSCAAAGRGGGMRNRT